MENTRTEELLRTGLRVMDLPDDAAPSMARFAAFLLERNRVMNLTAITEEADVAALHFLDSAALLKAADFAGMSVIDVGSGAGFPGIPLRLVEPSLRLTLLDAQRKRVEFLREASSLLGLSDVNCIHGRAEEYGQVQNVARQKSAQRIPTDADGARRISRDTDEDTDRDGNGIARGGRGRFDIAVSRAVASLPILAELCLPLVRIGGLFLAMKSVSSDSELAASVHAITTLGGKLERLYDYPIPGTDVRHRAVVIRKIGSTPKAYPRPFARIKKHPL